MRETAIRGAVVAGGVTLAACVLALSGMQLCVLFRNCLLFPGGLAAFGLYGDNYHSQQQFNNWAIALGIPLNAVCGACVLTLFELLKKLGGSSTTDSSD